MNKRGTGVIFCCIAAFLFGCNYLTAAIWGSHNTAWDNDIFRAMQEYIGSDLIVASVLSLCVGIGYLVWAEMEEYKHSKGK